MPKAKMDSTLGADVAIPDESAIDVVQNNSAAAVWSDTVDIPTEQLQVPWLTLTQGLSKAVTDDQAKMGQWYANGYGAFDTITIVPLQFGISRRYAVEDKDSENGLLTHCYSPTGHEHGIAETELGPGIACAECPLKDWTPTDQRDERGRIKNAPPLCKESLDFLVWCDEIQSPARMSFRSTGSAAGRQIATLGRTRGLKNFAIELGAMKKSNGRFTFAVPTVKMIAGDVANDVVDTARIFLGISPDTVMDDSETPF